MSRSLAALSLSLALPVSAPACLAVREDDRRPFDIDPPTVLVEIMLPELDVTDGRSWSDRCLDHGGVPTVLDGVPLCIARDY